MLYQSIIGVGIVLGFVLSSGGEPNTKSTNLKERIEAVEKLVAKETDSLIELYTDLHKNPELSLMEERSAAKMAQELEKLGFEVTTGVGKTGVVGLLKNGNGPVVLVRADMDALPVVEQTGLPYASKVKTRNAANQEVGVMHACGHDMHMTCWVGAARVLAAMKDQWKGTLMFIAQPAEEIGTGARLMLADGLFKRFPKPNYCLALHCDSTLEVGHINYTEGLAMANVDSVDILVKGKGGHGSQPHTTIDPIVIAARIVLDLQTIISREKNPSEPAVITVGSIHGGTKHNIIPNEVKLQITVRTTRDSTRKEILESIARVAKAAALASKAPEPEVSVQTDEFTPALVNDRDLTRKTISLFKDVLGEDKLHERPTSMGGEDFSRYALGGEIPIFMYFLGTISKDRVEESKRQGGKPLPSMHSDSYYPQPDLSMKVGVKTMALAVLNLNGK